MARQGTSNFDQFIKLLKMHYSPILVYKCVSLRIILCFVQISELPIECKKFFKRKYETNQELIMQNVNIALTR